MAVFSLISENLGRGIIVKNNKLNLDTSSDFVWTGKNFFTKSVIFSQEQILPIQYLSHDNTALGSLVTSNGSSWQALSPGSIGQYLTISNKGLLWSKINIENSEGILPLSRGGTGWGNYPFNGILFNSGKDILDLLPIPTGKKVLISNESNLQWENFSEFSDEIFLKMPKFFEVVSNKFIFSKQNPVLQISDVIPSGIHQQNNKTTLLSINHTDFQGYLSAFPTTSIVLNNENKNNLFEIYSNINDNIFSSIFSIDSQGKITKGFIETSNLVGILQIQNGGTGLNSYDAGDIVFAKNNLEFNTLKTKNCEGFILKVVNGLPSYVPHDKSDFDGNFSIPVKFSQSINNSPPVLFSKSKLLDLPIIGGLEFDGDYLYLTTLEKRKKIIYSDSDINGLSENVRGIISISNGGTGKDLSSLNTGSLIVKDNQGNLNGLENGPAGSVLISLGNNEQPVWDFIFNNIETNKKSGIILEIDNSKLNIDLDTSENFDPVWSGNHKFLNNIEVLNSQLILSPKEKNDIPPLKINKSKTPLKHVDGEIWYDGKDLFMSTMGKNINITKVDDNSLPEYDYVPSHYLCLGAGSEVLDNRKIRMKVPVPHLVAKGSLVHAKWRVRRLEIILDEPPSFDNANFRIFCNNKIVLNSGIILQNSDKLVIDTFDESFVETGELIQVECLKTGGSNFWSIFMLIDLI